MPVHEALSQRDVMRHLTRDELALYLAHPLRLAGTALLLFEPRRARGDLPNRLRRGVVAHDRRGHGRSEQTWDGNDMDTYADDLAELIETLDLRDTVLVGHSTGGGEVTRYVGRHGTERVARIVLLGAIPPLMLKTKANPNGVPIEAFDQIRAGTLNNRSQFFKELAVPFYGFNRKGAKIAQRSRRH